MRGRRRCSGCCVARTRRPCQGQSGCEGGDGYARARAGCDERARWASAWGDQCARRCTSRDASAVRRVPAVCVALPHMPELLRGVCSAAEGAAAAEPAAKKAKPNTVSKRKLCVQPKFTLALNLLCGRRHPPQSQPRRRSRSQRRIRPRREWSSICGHPMIKVTNTQR